MERDVDMVELPPIVKLETLEHDSYLRNWVAVADARWLRARRA